MLLQGKVAIITGGNRGLGLSIAKKYLEAGAKVAICCAPKESNAEAITKLKSFQPDGEIRGDYQYQLNGRDFWRHGQCRLYRLQICCQWYHMRPRARVGGGWHPR